MIQKTIKILSTSLLLSRASKANTQQTEETGGDHCYALAMSGGGVKGAFEAGALWGMYNQIEDKKSMEYDVVTGVSAGAINAIGVSLFSKEDTANMVRILSETW